ncbi:MAG: diguanylate cyclase [Kangiellaceae bacterium]|nr:diguanylate cyclase [Kangiellaceae bacterium]MCW9000063.1 diguanylate cyclase [Kangiellaceae bacterium]MCW9018247.1 diguanylate cyclase [Kangiellaceae bacterium]
MERNYPLEIDKLLALFVAQSNDGYAIFDLDDRLMYANPSYTRPTLGVSPEQVIGKTFDECIKEAFQSRRGIKIETADIEQWLAMARQKRWQQQFRSFEVDLLNGKWLLITEQIIGDKFLFLHSTDISRTKYLEKELREAQSKLYQQAYFDELTQISNRRAFVQRAAQEVEKASRNANELTLFLFDIDHFKKINDSHGHPVGDKVLKQMCQVVNSQLRSYDIFARIGGEEFALIFTDTSQLTCCSIVERIRLSIQCHSFKLDNLSLSCTVSFGGATLNASEKFESLMSRADKNLYQAKRAGRNQSVL